MYIKYFIFQHTLYPKLYTLVKKISLSEKLIVLKLINLYFLLKYSQDQLHPTLKLQRFYISYLISHFRFETQGWLIKVLKNL